MSNRAITSNPFLILTIVAAFAPLLGGCGALVVGGAVVGATIVAQDRPASEALSDTTIHANIDKQLLEFSVDVFQKVDISVSEGKVLLTGLVPEPQNRLDAARIGLSGYSQGGWVAPLAASRAENVAFLVIGSGSVSSVARDRLFERVGGLGQ